MEYPGNIARTVGTPIKLTLCGLEYAGKTALVHRWKTGEFKQKIDPTLSCTIESTSIRGGLISATIFDLGGQESLRIQWKEYLKQGNAIIFVIDAFDTDRYMEVREEFQSRVIPLLEGKPCVILCNKLDLLYKKEAGMTISDLIAATEKKVQTTLNLPMNKDKLGQFDIIATSMVNGIGLKKLAQFLRLKLAS